MRIRAYRPEDCARLAALFYDTVHTVNAADYTLEQRNAWATDSVDLVAWNASFLAHCTLVAEEEGRIVGFGDMEESGYLDRLYVDKAHQNRGIATALCDALEGTVRAERFCTQASLTALRFFAGRGYRVVRAQQVRRGKVLLPNYVMEKDRRDGLPGAERQP